MVNLTIDRSANSGTPYKRVKARPWAVNSALRAKRPPCGDGRALKNAPKPALTLGQGIFGGYRSSLCAGTTADRQISHALPPNDKPAFVLKLK